MCYSFPRMAVEFAQILSWSHICMCFTAIGIIIFISHLMVLLHIRDGFMYCYETHLCIYMFVSTFLFQQFLHLNFSACIFMIFVTGPVKIDQVGT